MKITFSSQRFPSAFHVLYFRESISILSFSSFVSYLLWFLIIDEIFVWPFSLEWIEPFWRQTSKILIETSERVMRDRNFLNLLTGFKLRPNSLVQSYSFSRLSRVTRCNLIHIYLCKFISFSYSTILVLRVAILFPRPV